MSWDFDYEAGPPGGSLTDIDTYCYDVRVTSEPTLGYRGRNPILAYRHGEESSPRKFHPAANVLLETWLRYTNSSGAVTHTDGRPGHVYENYGSLKALLTGAQASLIRLQRTAPEQGTVYMDVELVAEGRPTQAQHIIGWPLRAPHPFWIGAASAQQSPTTVTNGGTAPVMDAIIAVTGTANTPRATHSVSEAYIEIVGALPAGGVTVDVGAQTCTRISGGADWSGNLRINQPGIWMELDPGANTIATTESSGSPSWTFDFALQYR